MTELELALHWNGFPWQVSNWDDHVALLKACGVTWVTHLVRPNQSPDAALANFELERLAMLREAGFKIRLWVVADPKECAWVDPHIVKIDAPASPTSPDLIVTDARCGFFLRHFAWLVRRYGIPPQADAIALAWSGTFEIDERLWASPEKQPAARDAVAVALRVMIRALGRRAMVNGARPRVPIGAQRGSLSHGQGGRCNYYVGSPQLPVIRETATWLADVTPWDRWYGGGRVTNSETEFLAFGSDLARGTQIPFIVNEHDDPAMVDSDLLLLDKATVLVSRGIAPAIIDASYAQLQARQSVLNDIADLCAQAPRAVEYAPAQTVTGTLAQAFSQWQGLGGDEATCVPIRWMF